MGAIMNGKLQYIVYGILAVLLGISSLALKTALSASSEVTSIKVDVAAQAGEQGGILRQIGSLHTDVREIRDIVTRIETRDKHQ